MSSSSNEKLLKQVSGIVKFKKAEGTFALLENRIVWTPKDSSAKNFQCSYSDIKVQRISPETSSKVQLQIVFHNDSSYNFHFANSGGRPAQLKDRDEIKDLLAELIPQHRQKVNKDLEKKNKVFKERPDLFQLYKELVVSGIISSEEFWENQKLSLSESSAGSDKQDVGIASGFLSELKPDMHGCNELRFNLTADNINAIFKMYPAVKKKFVDTVPSEVTEKEFWTEFFQSQYFHRDRIQTSSSTKDVFGELAKKDEEAQLKKITEDFYDPLIDFESIYPIAEEGYGSGFKQRINNEALLKQFNHQSLMVLHNLKRKSASNAEEEYELKKKRVREAVGIEDLGLKSVDNSQALQVTDSDKFFQKPLIVTDVNGHTNGVSRNDILQFQIKVQAWSTDLSKVMTANDARTALYQLSTDSGKSDVADSAESIPAHLKAEMRKNYNSIAELLRHFWSCFPVRTPQLEEKIRRMAVSIEKYRDTKLANFICMQPASNNKMAEHMANMIDVALKKYRTWEERRSSKTIKK